MGLFDKFKEKKGQQDSNPARSAGQQSELHSIISVFAKNQGPDTVMRLSKVLKDYVDLGVWVPIPAVSEGKRFRLHIIESNGKAFAAMYSDPSEVKRGMEIVMTDINNLVEPVFASSEIDGIVIDPYTTYLCIEKWYFLKCILHDYLPKQTNGGTPQRNWGVGIPTYNESDLMSEGELLNFAMHTLLEHEDSLKAYRPISACDHPDAVANLIYEDNGRFVLVKVCGYCADSTPDISAADKEKLKNYSKLFNATCYYAPIGFRSTDAERFAECLALKGDGFYANYTGLELIE